jgi:UDP-GlcNAc3NAcA epimerase
MKILTIIGARPQFIKAAPVSRELRKRHVEVLVHTGQHYDDNMSAVFFKELDIPAPDFNLEVGSGPHGRQTGAMLAGIEDILLERRPDRVLIYGDTNSTLAGALAAAKLQMPVCHIEAGLRSFNRRMPEEVNRVVADHLSDLLLCPSRTAMDNLAAEGILRGVHVVGDVMADALAGAVERAQGRSRIRERLGLSEKAYLLATVHRPENADDPGRLRSILTAFARLDEPVVFPVHPRTRGRLAALGFGGSAPGPDNHKGNNIRYIDPLGYLDMVRLEQSARMILTDSGGIQKEAYWLGVPCITLRDETEWVETVRTGWNIVTGADSARIVAAVQSWTPPATHPALYGDAQAAARCVERLELAAK